MAMVWRRRAVVAFVDHCCFEPVIDDWLPRTGDCVRQGLRFVVLGWETQGPGSRAVQCPWPPIGRPWPRWCGSAGVAAGIACGGLGSIG